MSSPVVLDSILVQAEVTLDPQHTRAEVGQWVYRYRITIENRGEETVTLQRRMWRISDANGHVEVVEGPGVVGEYPRLAAGERFQYESWCPLRTPWGSMDGHYTFETEDGTEVWALIPAFTLIEPSMLH